MNKQHPALNLPGLLLIFGSALLLIVWLVYTPSGMLGKADAVGYAVCHQIAERSFSIDGRPIALCSRCTGMYLGALAALIYQLKRGKRGNLPSKKVSIILILFLAAFGIDGVNSYLHFLPSFPNLYTPQNWLRLATGIGMGIGMAAMLYPIFNQCVWKEYIEEPVLDSWRHIGELTLIGILVGLITLTQNPLVLYPFTILSSLTVLAMLAIIYTIIWIMLLKKENQAYNLKQIWWVILLGLDTALLQIAAMDLVRYLLTGTWSGFSL